MIARMMSPAALTIASDACSKRWNRERPRLATVAKTMSNWPPSVVSEYGGHRANVKMSSNPEITRAPVLFSAWCLSRLARFRMKGLDASRDCLLRASCPRSNCSCIGCISVESMSSAATVTASLSRLIAFTTFCPICSLKFGIHVKAANPALDATRRRMAMNSPASCPALRVSSPCVRSAFNALVISFSLFSLNQPSSETA
mmetsp:Transcript_7482/g.19235  ORF Transcript_7482/g.19235 Transcript_7482/m.19235 type:complete len:201 (-) Transcript_7482:26-628(-)